MSFIISFGCDYLKEPPKQINTDFGIFRSFGKNEPLRQHMKGVILPAKNNTQCPTRGKCSMDCHQAVYCVQSGYKVFARTHRKSI